MENKPLSDSSDTFSANPVLASQPLAFVQPKSNLLLPLTLTLLTSAIIFGFGGYYLGKQTKTQQNTTQIINSASISPVPSPLSTLPVPSSIPMNDVTSYTNSEYGFSLQIPQGFITQNQAAGAGIHEAPSNARSFYVYKVGDTESYINRYINFEVLGLEPSYPTQWVRAQTSVGGKTATKLTDSSKASSFDIYLVELNNNQGVVEIYVSNTADKSGVASEILSSLNFTN